MRSIYHIDKVESRLASPCFFKPVISRHSGYYRCKTLIYIMTLTWFVKSYETIGASAAKPGFHFFYAWNCVSGSVFVFDDKITYWCHKTMSFLCHFVLISCQHSHLCFIFHIKDAIVLFSWRKICMKSLLKILTSDAGSCFFSKNGLLAAFLTHRKKKEAASRKPQCFKPIIITFLAMEKVILLCTCKTDTRQ